MVAAYLAEHGVHRVAFADELKRYAMELWDLSFEQMYGGDDVREVVDPRWGVSPRFIMQQFGTEVGRSVHKDTWVRKTLRLIDRAYHGASVTLPDFKLREFRSVVVEDPTRWSIPDARFPDEANAIRAAGGVVIKVVRPSIVSVDTHASETSVDDVVPDHLIVNDGTLDDLRAKVADVASRVLS
jgi:hypothetical protein